MSAAVPRDPAHRLYSARAVRHTAADVRTGGPEHQHRYRIIRAKGPVNQWLGAAEAGCQPIKKSV